MYIFTGLSFSLLHKPPLVEILDPHPLLPLGHYITHGYIMLINGPNTIERNLTRYVTPYGSLGKGYIKIDFSLKVLKYNAPPWTFCHMVSIPEVQGGTS